MPIASSGGRCCGRIKFARKKQKKLGPKISSHHDTGLLLEPPNIGLFCRTAWNRRRESCLEEEKHVSPCAWLARWGRDECEARLASGWGRMCAEAAYVTAANLHAIVSYRRYYCTLTVLFTASSLWPRLMFYSTLLTGFGRVLFIFTI